MTGGGEGSDVFVCAAEGLQRYWVTEYMNPSLQVAGTLDTSLGEDKILCEFSEGTGRMILTRT